MRLRYVFVGALIIFGFAALLIGLPGVDGDVASTYTVITFLANSLTYHISRLPGQPFLDYCNFIGWTIGGDFGIQIWYVIVSALGISCLYGLAREARGSSPLLAALTLGLHPFFIGHVGGLGDFAVGISFLIISLWAGIKRWPGWAGLALALSVGCRLSMCIYVVPLMVLVALTYQEHGLPPLQAWRKAILAGGVAGLLSLAFYAPLFAFRGWELLNNFPMMSITHYHIPAFLYHMFVGLGITFWLTIAAVLLLCCLQRKIPRIKALSGIDWAAILMIFLGMAIFFRVPTKPELVLPILLGCILLFQRWTSRKWAAALLVSSMVVGLLNVSPYDRGENRYVWNLRRGWYAEDLFWAHKNRLDIRTFREFLASRPGKTILVSWLGWSKAQADKAHLITIYDYRGIKGLRVFAFPQLGDDRVIVEFHEKGLQELLRDATSGPQKNRAEVFYEKFIYGLTLRDRKIDLSKFGHGVVLQKDLLKDLWDTAGRPSTDLAIP
jgi:hypothetical protein